MPTITQTKQQTDGFAVPPTDTTDLGLAMMILESADGHYKPIGVVCTIQDAEEVAVADKASRAKALERGAEPFCPERYVVWARGANGKLVLVHEIDAN